MPEILAETDDLLVINKPSGVIVHSDGRTVEPSVAAWLIEKYPQLIDAGEPWTSPQGERVPVAGLVHRLDRTTSGILLAAKTPTMYAYLKNEFKARRVEKRYLAYVHGEMESERGRIVAEIVRSSTPPRKWYARDCSEEDRRAAITDWRLLRRQDGISYVEVFPRTGRTHQIRVHFAHIGHPLVGDAMYGTNHSSVLQNTGMNTEDETRTGLKFSRPALHAASICFTLPTGERVTFEVPLQPDFP